MAFVDCYHLLSQTFLFLQFSDFSMVLRKIITPINTFLTNNQLKYFNFISITGAMGICFPYLGEFQPTKHREKILCWMELFWTVGIILLPRKLQEFLIFIHSTFLLIFSSLSSYCLVSDSNGFQIC